MSYIDDALSVRGGADSGVLGSPSLRRWAILLSEPITKRRPPSQLR